MDTPRLLTMAQPISSRFDLILKEQLAAQAVAVIDAHFKRPDIDDTLAILRAAIGQVEARRLL